jgi:RHS repeat-associated protein
MNRETRATIAKSSSSRQLTISRILIFAAIFIIAGGRLSAQTEVLQVFENGPADKHRETGLLGDKYVDHFSKYHDITCGGDLDIKIPLGTIPGKIPIDLILNYKSGITMDQPATWVGLGWSLAQWSVRRIPVLGDDPNTWVQDRPNTRFEINDMYQVSMPGRSLKFINTGTMASPVYSPLSYTNDSLFSENHLEDDLCAWDFWDHDYFILVDDKGTRYVFGLALSKKTDQPPRSLYTLYNGLETTAIDSGAYCEWLLTAILSHDYVDGGGDPLDPLDAVDDPRTDNKGAWVAFVYTHFEPKGSIPVTSIFEEFTKGVLQMGPMTDDADNPDVNDDVTEFACLRKIITPNLVAFFDLHLLHNYKTPRFLRSHWMKNKRTRDCVLSGITLYEYSGDSTLPSGPELYSISFDYKDPLDPSVWPLKAHLYSIPFGGSYKVGEPALRQVTISTYDDYKGNDLEDYPLVIPQWDIYPACEQDSGGYKRRYTFEYIDSLPLYDHVACNDKKSFNDHYTNWSRGGYSIYGFDPDDTDDQNSVAAEFISPLWMSREFFGYYYYHPEIWSLCKLTIPEGLTFEYVYEPDQYALGGGVWTAGGCRVKSIIVNSHGVIGYNPPNPPVYPSLDDYYAADTIRFSYGYDDNGIGFAGSMPTNYERFKTRYKVPVRQLQVPEHTLHYAPFIEAFQGDNVDHMIQYPLITRHLPRGRGTIEQYYITSDSLPGHHKHTMSIRFLAFYENFYHQWVLYDTLTLYNSFWQDRSPFSGMPYMTIQRNGSGEEVSYAKKFYSWIPIKADTFVADGYDIGMIFTSDAYVRIGCTPFPVGDTIAATYFVRLDSTVERRDGVPRTILYSYDALCRVGQTVARMNDHSIISNYEYASSYYPHMRRRHYLSDKKTVEKSVMHQAAGSPVVVNRTENQYRSDFPSQNQSGQSEIWYKSATREWLDLDGDNRIGDMKDDDEWLTTEILDYDKYGNATLINLPDSVTDGAIYNRKGPEGFFENVKGNDYALLTAEADINNQIGQWEYGSGVFVDSSLAFTGRRSMALLAAPSAYRTGPEIELYDLDSGLYLAEMWGRCVSPNRLSLTISGGDGHFMTGAITELNKWQRVVCSLQVPQDGSIRVYTTYYNGISGSRAWVDDLRIHPARTLVVSRTYDGILRTSTESDYNNIPRRFFYNQYNEQSAIADYRLSPITAAEKFYKTTEFAVGDSMSYRYDRTKPNAVYTFKCREPGIIDDFSEDPFLKYTFTGTGGLHWDTTDQRLMFTQHDSESVYTDFTIPLDTFSDGFIAFDIAVNIYDPFPKARALYEPSFDAAPVWFGFETAGNSGYALAFPYYYGAELVRYSAPDYGSRVSLGTARSRYWKGFATDRKARLMLGKIGADLYIFYNNDCLRVLHDESLDKFTKIRMRFRSFGGSIDEAYYWIDNLAFYNDPVIIADFVNSYGMLKQRLIYDGDKITVSGEKNTNDFKTSVIFNPIAVDPFCHYNETFPCDQNLATCEDHRCPFDYVKLYLNDGHMYHWQPGDALADSDYICTYFSDSGGTPNCFNDAGRLVPYMVKTYHDEPLRRIKQVKNPGRFSVYPQTYEYGASEKSIPGFSPVFYGAGMTRREKAIDEMGNIDITYKDDADRTIALVEDSTTGGINALTRFYPDYNGNDTLLIQPRWAESYPLDCGNVDNKGVINILDVLFLITYVYKEGLEPEPIEIGDVDGSGLVNMLDITYLFNYVYKGGRAPRCSTPTMLKVVSKYNNLSWLTYDSSGDKGVTEYIYDRSGNLRFTRTASDREAGRFQYSKYDGHKRVIEEGLSYQSAFFNWHYANIPTAPTGPWDTVTARYEYDLGAFGRGHVSMTKRYAVVNPDSAVGEKFEYDEYGRVIRKEQSVYAIGDSLPRVMQAEYNVKGELKRLTYPSGKYVDYFYDRAGRASRVIDGDSCVGIRLSYWPGNQLRQAVLGLEQNLGPAQVVDYAYNARGWLETINDGTVSDQQNGPDDHYSLVLTYDSIGSDGSLFYIADVASYTLKVSPGYDDTRMAQRFTYDALGRLVGESYEGVSLPQTRNYTYDNNGNIQTVTEVSDSYPTVLDYVYYKGTNRLERIINMFNSPGNFQYTPSGSMSRYDHLQTDMKYDDNEALILRARISDTAADSVTYWYNADGQRVAKRYRYHQVAKDGQTTVFDSTLGGYYYFGDDMLSEYSGPPLNSLVGNYVYADNKRLAVFGDGPADVRYFLTDHLGSAVATVNYDGTLRNWNQYLPYGAIHKRVVVDPGASVTFGYTGKELDQELGAEWYYYGSRYYDPLLRTFLPVDPHKKKYPSLSPYLY